jgi:hypothetical protein
MLKARIPEQVIKMQKVKNSQLKTVMKKLDV